MDETRRTSVWIAAFGGLRIFRNGLEIPLGPQRPQMILAELVVSLGNNVSIEHLIHALWQDDPPSSAVNQIHRHVGEARRLLEPRVGVRSDGAFIERRVSGYRIQLSAVESQVESFFSDALLASRLAESGSDDEALEKFLSALSAASAPAFSGLPREQLAGEAFLALESERQRVAVDAADFALASGASALIAPLVVRIATSAPFNESLQARAVRLLGATGHRAEAMQLYEVVRQTLAIELGVSPGKDLSAALGSIAESRESVQSGPAATVAPVPSNLPPDIGYFVDRERIKDQLRGLEEDALSGRGVVALLTGMGGIGKTALAVHWARSLTAEFPDGQVYLNLLGFDPTTKALTPDEAIARLADVLKIPLAEGATPTEIRAAYRDYLGDRRVVIVLDNAKNSAQVRELLPGSARSLVIATSRDNLVSLAVRDGARRVPLERWSAEDSAQLWRLRFGPRGGIADEALASVLEFCAGLPLAVAIVAARPELQLDGPSWNFAEEVRALNAPLDVFSSTDEADDLRSTFVWSYRSLSSDAARLFRLLSIHPGPVMSTASIASLVEMTLDTTRALTTELVQSNMLTRSSPDHFVLHDLLRAFAGEIVESSERAAAETRLLDHYLYSLRNAWISAGREVLFPLATNSPAPLGEHRFATLGDAIEWYPAELDSVEAQFARAITLGLDRAAINIELDRRPMHEQLYRLSLSNAFAIVEAAERAGDDRLRAETHRHLANALGHARKLDEAKVHAFEARRLFGKVGDHQGLAATYRNMAGRARYMESAMDDAREYAECAVESARRSGDNSLLTRASLELLASRSEGGDPAGALEMGPNMLELAKRWLPSVISDVHEILAESSFLLGDYRRALHESQLASGLRTEKMFRNLSNLSIGAAAASRIGDRETATSLAAAYFSMIDVHGDVVLDWYQRDMGVFDARVQEALHPDADPRSS